MSKENNTKKNRYQILIIICAIAAIIYGYCFYVSARLHNSGKMWFNGIICIAWLLCAVLWFALLKRINGNKS